MKHNSLSFIFAASLCAVTLCTATSCSKAQNPKNLPVGASFSIELAPRVHLEVVKIPSTDSFGNYANTKVMAENPSDFNGADNPEEIYVLFGKYEVTQAQWDVVMGDNPSRFKNPDNPVEMVSWDDCQTFLQKLNALSAVKKSGLTFRLPTEEEWEYARRAGSPTSLFGDADCCQLADGTKIEEVEDVAWFKDNSDGKTHPVGQKKPNAFGLYDMYGNVSEWTSGLYDKSGNVAEDGEFHVQRGSDFNTPWLLVSSARFGLSPSDRYRPYDRGWDSPSARYYNVGFRLFASGRAD